MATSENISIKSNDIRVFPTTLRETTDPSAKFTTEYNLTSLLNKLLDRKAFVITPDSAIRVTRGIDNKYHIDTLEFNIEGYFFVVNNLDLSSIIGSSTTGYINASIKVARQDYTEGTQFKNWWQLQGADEASIDNPNQLMYNGINFKSAASATFKTMDEYISGPDIGIVESYDGATAEDGDVATYTFTILQYDTQNPEGSKFWIPADSRIKFQTNKDGTQHSLAIDDGELVPQEPVQQTFNLRRPSAPIVEESFDGLALNVSNLSLFESELFRLEVEYDNIGDIIFTSSDNNIATVSSNGLIRGINKGNCLIIASYKDMNAICNVIVK